MCEKGHQRNRVVFADKVVDSRIHGIWADGSCFGKVIPKLRADGDEVMAAQYRLDTLKGDTPR
jgi:hypothetical protein